jgi:hypothetical protein
MLLASLLEETDSPAASSCLVRGQVFLSIPLLARKQLAVRVLGLGHPRREVRAAMRPTIRPS